MTTKQARKFGKYISVKSLRCSIALTIIAGTFASVAHAQSATDRPAYKGLRADEDWSSLSDPTKRTDFFDPIKWIPLSSDGSWYMTFGGELRERYESSRYPVFGLEAPDRNDQEQKRTRYEVGPN